MKFYKQDDPSLANNGGHDCPIACLRCVLEHFGSEVSRDDLLNSFPGYFKKDTGEEGALDLHDLSTLVQIGKHFGFLVSDWLDFGNLDEEFAACDQNDLLWIVLTKKDAEHVVVVRNPEDNGRVKIMDPKYDDFVTVGRDVLEGLEPRLLKLSKG